jgi:hypothetical protein
MLWYGMGWKISHDLAIFDQEQSFKMLNGLLDIMQDSHKGVRSVLAKIQNR